MLKVIKVLHYKFKDLKFHMQGQCLRLYFPLIKRTKTVAKKDSQKKFLSAFKYKR